MHKIILTLSRFLLLPISRIGITGVIMTPALLASTIVVSANAIEKELPPPQPEIIVITYKVKPIIVPPPPSPIAAKVFVKTVLAVDKIEPTNNSGFRELFEKYGNQYGVSAEMLEKIAKCESGFNPHAINGSYGGLYQFHPNTWVSARKKMGADEKDSGRFDSEEAIKTAAFKISQEGTGAWPVCGRST